jgi:glycosyltransferase involved in cell wall biosynthesis
MEVDPMVSVVMITYAHEPYIEEAINGVLMQNCNFEVELIIANDCSPDNTDEVVQNIIKTHPKAHWIDYTRHKKNKGMTPNALWALEQCKGKYIALCEGDDYWTDPLKLQKQVDFLEENPGYSLCFTHQLVVTEKGEVKSKNEYPEKRYTTIDVVKGFIPGTQTLLFKNQKDLMKLMLKYSDSPSGDRILTYCCSLYGDLYLLPEFTAAYRHTGKGVWTAIKKDESYFFSLEEFVKFHISIGLPANNELVHEKFNGAYPYLFNKNKKYFFKNIRRVNRIKKKYKIKSNILGYVISKIL